MKDEFRSGCVSIAEPLDLRSYVRPLAAIPERVERAIGAGVRPGSGMTFASAPRLLDVGGDGFEDGVFRNPDGTLTVCCRTEMPGVTPAMWDWWFGWHGISSARYRLWHPVAHVWAGMVADRSRERDVRARYVDNISYVDEVIGRMLRLSIAFRPPAEFGLPQDRVDRIGTAICARTGFRDRPLLHGRLIHLVRRTPDGCEMISRFYLGDVVVRVPLAGRLLSAPLNTAWARIRILAAADGLDLLRHCSEEMTHLAAMLPDLYREFADDDARAVPRADWRA